jgi:hypothetical protein
MLPTRGWSGRIRTVQASIVHLFLALPHSPLQGSPPSSNGRRIPDRWRAASGCGAAIHAISARPGHAHHRDMHSLAPRTPHSVPEAGEPWIEGWNCGAAPAGSRGELCCLGDTRYSSADGWEGVRGSRGPHLCPLPLRSDSLTARANSSPRARPTSPPARPITR